MICADGGAAKPELFCGGTDSSSMANKSQPVNIGNVQRIGIKTTPLTRIIHEASTAAAGPGMSTAYAFFLCARSVGLLDVLSRPAAKLQVRLRNPSVARLAATPVCAAHCAAKNQRPQSPIANR